MKRVRDALAGAGPPPWARDALEARARPACLTDAAGAVLDVNAAWRARLDAPKAGVFVLDALGAPEEARRAALHGRPFAAGRPFAHAFSPPFGPWVSWEGGPLGASGCWLHGFGTAETDGAALQARRAQEQAELLALANETVIVRDPESRVVGWNPAAEAMYGYGAAEARGRVTHDLLRTRFPESKEAVDRALFEPDGGFWEGELTHRKRDGGAIVVLSRQAVQRDARGAVCAILEVNWDITERKRAEERLAELNRTLERRVAARTRELSAANEELEAFAYTVAHDLRAPLRSIGGFANAVLEDHGAALDEEGRDMLRRVERNAERMDALIRDLLAYSHLGRSRLAVRPVALDAVFAAAIDDLAAGAFVTVEGPLPIVRGHDATLRQVVSNLLGNALKFVAPGVRPDVRVRTEAHGSTARVWVEDNGVGVPERHEQRVFRVFERLHTLEEYPGTGVGLAIVRRGLERLGGRAGVAARPGGGSAFWFELPLAEGA